MNNTPLPDHVPPRRSRLGLLLGLLLALALGGGGFYAARAGMLDPWLHSGSSGPSATPLPGIAFVPVASVIVGLGPEAGARHLKFTSQLEVEAGAAAEVTLLMPRILDVLNSYLRALSPERLEDPAAMVLIRAQLLRRIQIVTGAGRVRDLLVTEFILN